MDAESVPLDDVLYDALDYEILETLDEDRLDVLSDEKMDNLISRVKEALQNDEVQPVKTRRFQSDSIDFKEPQTDFVPNCKRWQICWWRNHREFVSKITFK